MEGKVMSSGRRRIELSATQVIASLLAAVTGAVAASFLGVAGTIIGTAVMSVASTAIAAIYKGGLISSRERLRAAAEAARVSPLVGSHLSSRHRATGPGEDPSRAVTREDRSHAATGEDRSGPPARQELSRAGTREDRPRPGTREDRPRPGTREDRSRAGTREDRSRAVARHDRAPGPDDETQILPAVAFRAHRWDDTDRANGLSGGADGATQIVRRPDLDGREGLTGEAGTEFLSRPDEAARTRDDGGAGGRDEAARDDARWRPRPLVLAAIALGVFLLAMAGITAFEAVAGKPLNSLVAGGHGSGTTIGSIVGGSGSQTAPRHTSPARPSRSPSPSPRASTSPAPTPTPSPSTTPAPTPTPSPAPSASPGASPAASPNTQASPARAPATSAPAGP
jgi:hypothetical protein